MMILMIRMMMSSNADEDLDADGDNKVNDEGSDCPAIVELGDQLINQ